MIGVRNPRTGRTDSSITPPTADEMDAVCSLLRNAQPGWESIGVHGRTDAMRAWREEILAARKDIVAALAADTGRLVESGMEVDAIASSIERWCATGPDLLGEPGPRPAAIPIVEVHQGMRPYPLVGVISPWNFPLLLSLIDAVPALVAGCAVVVKPSEITPRFVDVVRPTIERVPALRDVLSYVVGAGETGAHIVDRVDLVCFTGSVPTGRRVAERAAGRFIPSFCELGGKDPALVLASADVDRASSAILWGSTANAGQSCQSIERVYVDRSVADVFVDAIVEKASRIRPAAPDIGDGEIGPIIAAKQIDVIASHLDDARERGAKVHTGGEVEEIGGGSYVRPTVLTDVDHTMKVMTEETFGPLIPVMVVDGTEEAVRWANDTVYGLSAAVFGEPDEALAVARRLDAGGISINDAALTALVHDGEKQSFKLSGLGGSRMGPAALRRFTRRQAYLVRNGEGSDPWWFSTLH